MKNKVEKVALLTGAAKRIGREMALYLARHGMNIGLHYFNSEEDAELLRAEIEELGVRVCLVAADFSHKGVAARVYEQVAKTLGPPSLLINNASIYRPMPFLELSEEELQQNLQVHGVVPLLLMQEMARSGQEGQIVNILDGALHRHSKDYMAYLASKRLLWTWNQMMAIELAPRLRVNAIAPGPFLPEEGRQEDVVFDRVCQLLPLNRPGQLPELLTSLEYLLQNPYVTGQVLYVDGGLHLVGRSLLA